MVNSEKCSSNKRHRGPWLVRRATKKGKNVISLRFPSEAEREKNRMREKMRRKISSNIYAGIRASGGYELPKNADNNLLLIALCEEAGWKVDEDGNISRKGSNGNAEANHELGDDNVDLRLSL